MKMSDEERATAVRLQRRTVDRLRKAAIEHLRAMCHLDARRARGEAVQALFELDQAEIRLTEFEGLPTQLDLPALPAESPKHPDDPSPTVLPFESDDTAEPPL